MEDKYKDSLGHFQRGNNTTTSVFKVKKIYDTSVSRSKCINTTHLAQIKYKNEFVQTANKQ